MGLILVIKSSTKQIFEDVQFEYYSPKSPLQYPPAPLSSLSISFNPTMLVDDVDQSRVATRFNFSTFKIFQPFQRWFM